MKLTKLTDAVYYLPHIQETDRPILGLVTGTKASLVIDAGNSKNHAQLFINQCAEVTNKPIEYLILTHWHWDHVFGTELFDCKIISNSYNATMMEKMSLYEWTNLAIENRVKTGEEIEFCREHIFKEFPDDNRQILIKQPNKIIDNETKIDLGGITCKLINLASDHNPDSTIVYIPENKILFLGDILYMDMYNGNWSFSTRKLFPLLDKIEEFNADYHLCSHQNPIDNKTMRSYLSKLRQIGELADLHLGNRDEITFGYKSFNKELDSESIEIIDAFVNDWSKREHLKN